MKKMLSLILALVFCLSFCITAYAEEFVDSPGQNPPTEDCTHEKTELINQKDADCDSNGYSGDLVCSDCGKVIEEGSVIAKQAHEYDEHGFCIHCGELKNPSTGDNAPIGLMIGVMVIAAAALVAVVFIYKKKFARN